MRWRRAGQPVAPPVARPPLEISCRVVAPPERLGAIRGLAELVSDRQQTEAFWREVWAEEQPS